MMKEGADATAPNENAPPPKESAAPEPEVDTSSREYLRAKRAARLAAEAGRGRRRRRTVIALTLIPLLLACATLFFAFCFS